MASCRPRRALRLPPVAAALELRLGDQRQERQHQLVRAGAGGCAKKTLSASRCQADGEVVGQQLAHGALDVTHDVAIGDHLVVGDQHPGLDSEVLQGTRLRREPK